MNRQAQELRLFFYSQQLADGLRITIAVLLPTVLLSYFGYFDLGISLSLGAACVSIVDAPGPIVHRKNSMLFCLLFVFITVFVTGYARLNDFTMGIEILLFSFFFSMLNVYGLRAAMIGNAALLSMVLTMDNPLENVNVPLQSFLIFCGGVFYLLISLLAYKVRPYRTAQRALGHCIRELSAYLSIKADFYNCATDLDEDYRKLLAQQVIVNERQDAVRELLFKTREMLNESTKEGRSLVLAFVDSVDLFEEITASYYDYKGIRDRYKNTGILETLSLVIKEMAIELEQMGAAIQMNNAYKKRMDYDAILMTLKKQIDKQPKEGEESHLILKKILVNLRKIMQRFTDIFRYFEVPAESKKGSKADHLKFVTHQSLGPKIFFNNLNLHSSVFKNAIRVSIACVLAFIIAKSMAYGHHSYWIVMTVIFMVKPAFSLTKQRNFERVSGTLIGGIIGAVILFLVKDSRILFSFMVLFMIGTYSFQRVKYFVAVISMTPYILIMFHFFGIGFQELFRERLLDTIIGSLIAVLAGYLIFPNWESSQLRHHMSNMLKANSEYLQKITDMLVGKQINMTDYKLARKEVYVHSANLSAALQRMLSEPKNKQKNKREIHHFVVLNHILFSNIATIASTVAAQGRSYPHEVVRAANKALKTLCNSLKKFNADCIVPNAGDYRGEQETPSMADDILLREQLEFVYRVSLDISKTTDAIIGEETIRSPAHNPSAPAQ